MLCVNSLYADVLSFSRARMRLQVDCLVWMRDAETFLHVVGPYGHPVFNTNFQHILCSERVGSDGKFVSSNFWPFFAKLGPQDLLQWASWALAGLKKNNVALEKSYVLGSSQFSSVFFLNMAAEGRLLSPGCRSLGMFYVFYHMIYGQNTLKHPFLTTRAITISLYLNQEQCHWWLELHCLMALAIWSLGSGSDRVLKRKNGIWQESMNSLCWEVCIWINIIFLVQTDKRRKRRVLVYLKVDAFIMGFQQRHPPLTTSNVSPGMFIQIPL